MNVYELNGIWHATCIHPSGDRFSYEARVPGCALADLIRAGKLPQDIFWRDNADAAIAAEDCDYLYRTSFVCDAVSSSAVLRFERIDTYADVYLNGQKIYHSENGNLRHDIPLHDALRVGENALEVHLYSPVRWVKDRPSRNGAFTTERLHTRRMQCTYGWDWVARFVTCGLGDCRLLSWERDEAIADSVYITTQSADEEHASVRVDLTLREAFRPQILTLSVSDPDGVCVCQARRFCAEDFSRWDLDVPSPRLWYPLGYGEQPLYTLRINAEDGMLHEERFGIRTVTIVQLPDAEDSRAHRVCAQFKNAVYDRNDTSRSFTVKINGVKIFCRGANWVPCQPFVDEATDERITELLELCAGAGVNMLRVWGGGAFESRHFYNECSRLGITVTQDFLMACGNYPEEEAWFIEELQKEALYAVRLIRNQPCLLWWSGDNENAVNGSDTDEEYQGRRSAYRGIAPVLYREDPMRRFLPSSPYGGSTYASNTVGTTHNTQYLGDLIFPYMLREDVSDYKEMFKNFRARFIAEEPQFGAASLSTLRRFMTDDDIFHSTDMWLYHTKGNPALGKELFAYALDFCEHLLGTFVDGADRLFKFRYLQYEWIRLVMEQARREKGICSGIIFWMMNDCWPAAAGWSLIDYYGKPKDGYYAFARCAKGVIASIDREGDTVRAYAVNDTTAQQPLRGTWYHLASDLRTRLSEGSFERCLEPNSSLACATLPTPADGELLVVNIEGAFGHDRTFYKSGALRVYPTEAIHMSVDEAAHTVTLHADAYVHAVMLDGEAVFEDNDFSLLAGECRTVSYTPLPHAKSAPIQLSAYTLIP